MGYQTQMGWKDALLNGRGNDLVVKIDHKLDVLELSTASSGDLLPSLVILRLKCSRASTIVPPSLALPKTTCLPSDYSIQMKNWELVVLFPVFAMDKLLEPGCFRMKFFSSHLSL